MDLRFGGGYRASEDLELLFLGELPELCRWKIAKSVIWVPSGPRLPPGVLDWEL